MENNKYTENEIKYASVFEEYYNIYGENIPDSVWTKLRAIRENLGVSLGRGHIITKEVMQNPKFKLEYLDHSDCDRQKESEQTQGVQAIFDYEVCHKNKDILLIELNNSSSLFYGSALIPDDVKRDIRKNFNISLEQELLMIRDTSFWNSRNQGLAITNKGIIVINDNDKPNDKLELSWKKIRHVEYKEMCIYFFDYNDGYIYLPISLFIKDTTNQSFVLRVVNRLVDIFNKIANSEEYEEERYNILLSNIDELIECKQYEEAKKVCIQYQNEEGDDAWIHIKLMHIANALGDTKKVLSEAKKGLQFIQEYVKDGMNESDFFNEKGLLYAHLGNANVELKNYAEARKDLFTALQYTSDASLITEYEKEYLENEKIFIETFSEQPYNTRKIILVVDNIRDMSPSSFSIVDSHNLPNISFPIGHPIKDQLYIGHPLLSNRYVPLESYELDFLEDRLREFCWLAQSLGAIEIKVESINSTAEEKQTEFIGQTKADLSAKLVKGEVEKKRSHTNDLIENFKKRISFNQRFSPINRPTVPDNLIWYEKEPSWQRLVTQRLQGGLLEHHEIIESSGNRIIKEKEIVQINADLKFLLNSGQIENKKNTDFFSSISENIELSIYIRFAPLNQWHNVSVKGELTLTPEEKTYREEILFYLEDGGIIDDSIRIFLEKKRIRLGVSKERAEIIEQQCKPQLSKKEQEYIELVHELQTNGMITERVRRMLERERESLGISKERATEIEKSVNL